MVSSCTEGLKRVVASLATPEDLTKLLMDDLRHSDERATSFLDDEEIASVIADQTRAVLSRFIAGLDDPDWRPEVPLETRHIARLAAANHVALHEFVDVYRRAHHIVESAVFEAAEAAHAPLATTRQICDRLARQVEALGELAVNEYHDEARRGVSGESDNGRLLRQVRSVLRPRPGPTAVNGYLLDRDHVAVVADGKRASELLAIAASRCGRAVGVQITDDLVWAWFAAARSDAVESALSSARLFAGIGESHPGRSGFRRSHVEAAIALRVLRRRGQADGIVRFAQVGIEALGLADEAGATTLISTYLGRLAGDGARTEVLRLTAETYLMSQQVTRTAALRLGVTERTVSSRLQSARELLPDGVDLSAAEVMLALRLQRFLVPVAPGLTG